MNKTVHIFFNGGSVILPDNNDWEKFGDIDALRTFLICADSWRRHGWEVMRLNSEFHDENNNFPCTPWELDGRVRKQFSWYPREYWQFIAKARSIAAPGLNYFATMDVINTGFYPGPRELDPDAGCYYFQPEHFSMSCFAATPRWLARAETTLIQYDRGTLPEIRATYISDERILRENLGGECVPVQKFACNPGEASLIHFARSTLARIYREIPLS